MSSDYYVIPSEYKEFEDQIRNLIDDIHKYYHYLAHYGSVFTRHLEDRKLDDTEYQKKYGHPFARDYGLNQLYPRILNYSVVISLFLAIENHLRVLTSIMYDQLGNKESFQQFLKNKKGGSRGGNFDKYLDFLCERSSVNRSKIDHLPLIMKLGMFRNCIVHVSGYLVDSKDKVEIERSIKSRDYLLLGDRSNPRIPYSSKDFMASGDLDIDEFEERLAVGGNYCKKACYYSEAFLLSALYHSGMAIYAQPA